MKRRLIKTSVLAAVSVVLLYYNVAWAVLRCPHQENHLDQAGFFESGTHVAEKSFFSTGRSVENIECTGPQFHTEPLASAPAQSELLRYTDGDTSSQAPDFLLAHPVAGDAWLNAVFDSFVPLIPTFYLSRYLSLSVLRF